ncbi:MAG TPA: cytochrome c [Rhizomicrobium sp.]|nr:cytochrome c [Rhizomicrobium sp.]
MSWFARPGATRRVLVTAAAAVVVFAAAAFYWIVLGPGPTEFAGGTRVALSAYHGTEPTGVPPELAGASLVKRGEYLARAADCTACHTARGGTLYAGGLAFVLPFGTIYSANITPDKDTGIGSWNDADFLNAVHKGIDRNGVPLYPAMPYASYTGMTDADALAIKAYLFSLVPVRREVPDNNLIFPFNQHWLIGVWSFLFNPDKRFEPNSDRSPQWNRGAYLAENMAHCGECHTPRNLAFALDNRSKFAGATQQGWRAYNITSDANTGVGAWSAAQLAQYLSLGHADGRGSAAGPMGEAVDKSLKYLTPDDTGAIAAYLQTVPAIASSDLPSPKAEPAPASHKEGVIAGLDPRGKHIFEGACASCHEWTGVSSLTRYATLTGARAVNDPTAVNVAQIVLQGTMRDTLHGKVFMPSFGAAYSDSEIAAVANYVTARFGAKPSAVTVKDVATMRRQD